MMWWYQAGGAGWIGFWFAFAFAMAMGFLLAVVFRSARPWRGRYERALSILRRRYAAGEISEAEFEQAKRVLGR